MARLLLLLGAAAGLFILFRWVSRQPARVQWQLLAVTVALTLLVLVLTGRAHWLTAVFAALLPLLRGLMTLLGGLPLLKRVLDSMNTAKSARAPGGGQKSTVQSRYIRMTLNHDTGDIDGEVVAGSYAGKSLNRLELDDLLQLLQECADDEESVALLQAYLDRVHGDSWQQQAGAERRAAAPGDGEMTRQEALEILGLPPDAGREDIVAAHRRLMQKLHPDRGGSAYLAARINLAKDILLDGEA